MVSFVPSGWIYSNWVIAYGFLDPRNGTGKTVGYILVIGAADIILFCLLVGATRLKSWIWPRGKGVTIEEESVHSVAT